MSDHTHGPVPASNSRNAFMFFVGCKVMGFLEGALPLSDAAIAAGTRTLVFDCGYGLTISRTGAFWIESRADVASAIMLLESKYRETAGRLSEMIALAGSTGGGARDAR